MDAHETLLQEAEQAGYVVVGNHIGVLGPDMAFEVEVRPDGAEDCGDLIFRIGARDLQAHENLLGFYKDQYAALEPLDTSVLAYDLAETLRDLTAGRESTIPNYMQDLTGVGGEGVAYWMKVLRRLAVIAGRVGGPA